MIGGPASLTAALILFWPALVLCQVSALPANPSPYVRLISSNPAFPRVSAASTQTAENAADVANYLHELVKNAVIRKEFARQARAGLLKAQQEGSRGVLLRLTKFEIWQGAIRHEQILGTGVETFVTAASASDACIVGRCWERLKPLPTGAVLTADSDFVWLERVPIAGKPDAVVLNRYLGGVNGLDRYSQMVVNDSYLSAIQRKESWGRRLESFVSNINARAQSDADRAKAAELLANRAQALDSIQSIEAHLARERERARKAADAAKVYQTLSSILSLGANLAIASGMVGQDISAGTNKGLADALVTIEDQSATRTRALESSLLGFADKVNKADSGIFELHVIVVKDPAPGIVLPELD